VNGLLLLLMASSPTLMSISGDSQCPTTAEVWRRLEPLLPVKPDSAGPDRLEIRAATDGLPRVTLETAEGVPLAERTVPFSTSCDRLADTIAALVASWETELHPAWEPATVTAPHAAEHPREAVAAPLIPSRTANILSVSPMVGSLGSSAAGMLAPGFLIGASVSRVSSHWSGHVSVMGFSPRTLPLGPGEVSWERLTLSVAVARTLQSRRPLGLDLQAGVLGGLVRVDGTGFTENSAVTRLDVGATAGLRAVWRSSHVQPWIGADLDVWPRAEEARVQALLVARPLPRLEPRVGIGVDIKIHR
jgi:hypothetical protein